MIPDKVIKKLPNADLVDLHFQYCLFEKLYKNISNKLKYKLCIPTCRNRKPNILEHIDDFKNSKVLAFIYEDEIDKYDWLSNKIEKVIVPKTYISCAKMRQFIQQYMGDQFYWVCDDDIKEIYFPWKIKKLNVFEGLSMIEQLVEREYPTNDFSYISPTHVEISCAFFNGENFSTGWASQCCLYNGKLCNEIGLKYTGDNTTEESIEFLINSYKCKKPAKVTHAFYVHEFSQCKGKNSIASAKEQMQRYVQTLKDRYSDLLTIKWCKTSYMPTIRVNYRKLRKLYMLDTVI